MMNYYSKLCNIQDDSLNMFISLIMNLIGVYENLDFCSLKNTRRLYFKILGIFYTT